jgi:hypothetical protein
VLGKHLLKAGVLASWNRKNEDTFGGGSFESPRLFYPTGLPAGGPTSGNVLADFLLRDMTWFFFEFSGQNRFYIPSFFIDKKPHADHIGILFEQFRDMIRFRIHG